jgi:hypothetical protein
MTTERPHAQVARAMIDKIDSRKTTKVQKSRTDLVTCARCGLARDRLEETVPHQPCKEEQR